MATPIQESLAAPPEVLTHEYVNEDALALAALDAELDARHQAASDAVKQRIDEHLEEAKHVTGGRIYELGDVVDRGHITRRAGGSAVAGVFGMSHKPYGMPHLRTRRQFNDPYINRGAMRY